ALDAILSRAMSSKDPEALNATIGDILRKVSPERQQAALNVIQQRRQEITERKQAELFAKAASGQATKEELQQLDPKYAVELEKVRASASTAGGITAKPVPSEIVKEMDRVIKENPNATAEELGIKFAEAQVPPIYYNNFLESRRQAEAADKKTESDRNKLNRQETRPFKEDIIKRGQAAEEGIRNKKALEEIIDKGNLDDPTFAVIAEAIPFGLGQRLLSTDTVTYKAALVEEFVDLQKIFKGQTRTAELNILQKKLADTYLTDEQKKAILKTRITALQTDIIRRDAARQVNPNLDLFAFEEQVSKLADKRMAELANEVIDKNKAIIDEAERKKQRPLDPDNPEDLQIIQQIYKEAGGDKKRAIAIAESKGYKVRL
ncbi:MAG: hypothetical protein VW258_15055, partial [Thalassolituus sp.]